MGDLADPDGDYYTVFSVILRPRSVGTVTCRSDSIFDDPLIDHRYLSDPDGYDRKVSTSTLHALIPRHCWRV